MAPNYKIEILDKTRTKITQVKNFAPLNTANMWLEYKDALSNWGTCKFRVPKDDPMFTQFGDILQPFFNHVRVYRAGVLVWSGIIVRNPRRTSKYIEVEARTYLYMLTTVLIKHDASVTAGDGKDNYRAFNTGTLADAVQAIMTETKSFVDSNNILKQVTVGVLENPNFPAGYVTAAGAPLTGAWTFSSDMTIQFDYRDVLYCLQMLANYPACDFELTKDLVFNFKQFIGTKQPNLVFEYGNYGSIDDYNVILDGANMANDITGVAADYGGQILHTSKTDDASIQKYGRIQGVAAYIDVKNKNALTSRLTEELRNTSTPDGEVQVTLNERAYPLGQYGLGDTITLRIKDNIIQLDSVRRIVAIDVKVHTTGREAIRLVTNPPKEGL